MGLTTKSTGIFAMKEMLAAELTSQDDIIIALAGNPNTGKSTVFNSLTGLKQHTGNWPGKTVTNASGSYVHNDNRYILIDLPGTYSLLSNSVEEEVARDFICFGNPHATVIVVDATCLERNLILALQILEITDRVILCVNLMDEAKRKKISVNTNELSHLLGIPVVATSARSNIGLDELKNVIEEYANFDTAKEPYIMKYDDIVEDAISEIEPFIDEYFYNPVYSRWISLRLIENDTKLLQTINSQIGFDITQNTEFNDRLNSVHKMLRDNNITMSDFRDKVVSTIVKNAEAIAGKVVIYEGNSRNSLDRKIDKVLTSKMFGIPIMIALLGFIFWLTIKGANYPSMLLSNALFGLQSKLDTFLRWISAPKLLRDIIVFGMYRTLAWVVSVMLPPMAIFFPLFTLLEDLGYLPRVAFNLDYYFKKACTHGKQALTMCMGFGCNAAGVIACRIIDSPRERLIATITNNFVPCNGRFPTLITLSTIFIAANAGSMSSFVASLSILAAIVLGVFITLFISKILSKTILKGLPSSFTLELPPYRKPKIGSVIIRSIFDRTLFVLGRAVAVAAPTGIVIWLMSNITIGNASILTHCAQFLNPFAQLIGLDGYILMAFILGFPTNEIVIPILIMGYMSKGSLLELDNLNELKNLFVNNGWTFVTALCMMIFSLNHWPCATTLWTIRKETKSWKWTFVSFLVPTLTGIILCFIVAQCTRLLGII